MHYDGTTWSPVVPPGPVIVSALRAVTGNLGGEVWIVGDGGAILYYDGKHWARWQDPSAVALRGVWFDAATSGTWIVGDQGTILHSGQATK